MIYKRFWCLFNKIVQRNASFVSSLLVLQPAFAGWRLRLKKIHGILSLYLGIGTINLWSHRKNMVGPHVIFGTKYYPSHALTFRWLTKSPSFLVNTHPKFGGLSSQLSYFFLQIYLGLMWCYSIVKLIYQLSNGFKNQVTSPHDEKMGNWCRECKPPNISVLLNKLIEGIDKFGSSGFEILLKLNHIYIYHDYMTVTFDIWCVLCTWTYSKFTQKCVFLGLSSSDYFRTPKKCQNDTVLVFF